MEKARYVLGVDVGRVIAEHDREDGAGDPLDTPPIRGAMLALSYLVFAFGRDNIFLVSKCGERMQARTLQWFVRQSFFSFTGINPNHAFFCKDRAGKAPICARLGVTHFVDDRLEVLGYLESVQHLCLFRPRANEIARHAAVFERREVHVASDWEALRCYLMQTIS